MSDVSTMAYVAWVKIEPPLNAANWGTWSKKAKGAMGAMGVWDVVLMDADRLTAAQKEKSNKAVNWMTLHLDDDLVNNVVETDGSLGAKGLWQALERRFLGNIDARKWELWMEISLIIARGRDRALALTEDAGEQPAQP